MKTFHITRSLNAGELSPLMNFRTDQDKYASGCQTLQNFFPLVYGGAQKRPGTFYEATQKSSSANVRLVDFVPSVDDAYILEFGNQYIRFYKDQAQLTSGGVAYEVTTPYLTADLFDLKFEHSIDVLYIYHPDYEDRKLSRIADTNWTLAVVGRDDGPFLDVNTDTTATITASGYAIAGVSTALSFFTISGAGDLSSIFPVGKTFIVTGSTGNDGAWVVGSTNFLDPAFVISVTETVGDATVDGEIIVVDGSVTLTASESTFVSAHAPNGSAATDKVQTGTLFEISHVMDENYEEVSFASAIAVPTYSGNLNVFKGVKWDFTTNGTWTGTVELQKSYDGGTTWITVHSVTSKNNKNTITDGAEEEGDALYRAYTTDVSSGTCEARVSVRSSLYPGIVEITAVASATSATATVRKLLYSADPTHRWAEGYFSRRYGWPSCGAITTSQRVAVGGQTSHPMTIHQSVSGGYDSFEQGSLDDDAMTFDLVTSSQQNQVRWIVSKKKNIVVGTFGGEQTLGPSDDNQGVTPTNVTADVIGTIGSANIQAIVAGDSILFVQRGGRRVMEMAYSLESDSLKSVDLTRLSEHITSGGIKQMAIQRTPEPRLWCVRTDGVIAVMAYNRNENVFSWSRIVTDGTFESIAIIPSGEEEDEVWVSVARTVGGATVRYIERFGNVDFGDKEDAHFVDCGIVYDSTATTTISGLSHLEGETVQYLADGGYMGTKTVSGGQITLDAAASVVHVGLAYTAQVKPMPLNIQESGYAAVAKIHNLILYFYETLAVKYGDSDLFEVPFHNPTDTWGDSPDLCTGTKEVRYDGGFDRGVSPLIQSDAPLPATLLGMAYIVSANVN